MSGNDATDAEGLKIRSFFYTVVFFVFKSFLKICYNIVTLSFFFPHFAARSGTLRTCDCE